MSEEVEGENPEVDQIPKEQKTLAEEITNFNKEIDSCIGELTAWKSRLFNLQETFIDKLRKKTLGMKIQ